MPACYRTAVHTTVLTVLLVALAGVQPVLFAQSAGPPPAPSSPDKSASIPDDDVRRILTERIEAGDAVGLVVARIEEGDVRVVAAGRRAGPGSAVPDGTTVFEIGSIAKVLTTLLLAEMVVRGEVALDDPIGRFLPEGATAPSRNGRDVTLRDLATQTSGLPRLPDNLEPPDWTNPYADYEADDLYRFLSSYDLPRDPGERYEYSNLGMGLLGHLLALRAGTNYEELVTQHILEPLGMYDTRLQPTPAMAGRLAQGHGPDLDPAPSWDFAVLAGAGGWLSTADDMARLLQAALSPPAGTLGEAFALALEPRASTGTPGLDVGLGWHLLDLAGRRIVWHNGQTGGYHAFIGFDATGQAAVAVLANNATDVDDIGMHLLEPSIPLRRAGSRQPAPGPSRARRSL